MEIPEDRKDVYDATKAVLEILLDGQEDALEVALANADEYVITLDNFSWLWWAENHLSTAIQFSYVANTMWREEPEDEVSKQVYKNAQRIIEHIEHLQVALEQAHTKENA